MATISRRRRWWHAVGYASSLGLLIVALAIACVALVVPKIAGAVPLTVLSDSMSPGMPAGSLAIVKPTMELDSDTDLTALDIEDIRARNDVDRIRIGDVIAFQPRSTDPMTVMHRVVGIALRTDGSREFTTRGDNNGVTDRPVQDYMVRGEVWYHLPYLGHVNIFVNSEGTRHMILIIVIATLGYAWAAYLLIRALRRTRRPANTEDEHESAVDPGSAGRNE